LHDHEAAFLARVIWRSVMPDLDPNQPTEDFASVAARLNDGMLRPSECLSLRQLLSWSSEELAARSGFSNRTISDFEEARRKLSRSAQVQLVRCFRKELQKRNSLS
jgi:DNA-binding transcriptional regulator YiaG